MSATRPERPFRFGVETGDARTAEQMLERIRVTEDLGYSTLTFADHLHAPWSPFSALAYAAAVTSKLVLTHAVLDGNLRHPALVANEGATIDVLSEGRFELGIGAGSQPQEHQKLGLPAASGAVRLARLAEAVTIVKGLWSSGEFTYRGEHYSVEGLAGCPRPFQRPRPRIRMGGFGRRMLELAAREADVVNPWIHWGDPRHGVRTRGVQAGGGAGTADPRETDPRDIVGKPERDLVKKLGWMRDAAGERFDDLEIELFCFVVVTDDPRHAARSHPYARAYYPGGPSDAALASPQFLFGPVDTIVDLLLERREKFGIATYRLIGESDVLHDFAPVVARLAGR